MLRLSLPKAFIGSCLSPNPGGGQQPADNSKEESMDTTQQIKAIQKEMSQSEISNTRYSELMQRLEWLQK